MSTANQTEGQIPFDQMVAEDWCELLCEKPQFADRCPWVNMNKLDGYDWSELLSLHPQFADKCPWEKLDDSNWRKLLCRQPQFAGNKPFKGENAGRGEEK